jgi:hypothetical protein
MADDLHNFRTKPKEGDRRPEEGRPEEAYWYSVENNWQRESLGPKRKKRKR